MNAMAIFDSKIESDTAEVPAQYGTRALAIEPRGAEAIPASERHGKPLQLLWTWSSPNFEFATIFVGFIGVAYFGLSPLQALAAILVGNGLAAFFHYVLSSRGPRLGLPQMVVSRLAFGWIGNILPATISSLIAGIGWFAVNSVSAALALSALLHTTPWLSLLIVSVVQIGVATFGYNLVQAFERYLCPILAIVFLLASVTILRGADMTVPSQGGGFGGFTLTAAACFGYAAGWNPYAADYTRYFSADRSTERKVGIFAAAGLFISTTVLEFVGAAAATLIPTDTANPVDDFTKLLPPVLAAFTLVAIALGASAANVLNVYSAALSFLAVGVRVGHRYARAITSAIFGITGTVVAFTALPDAGSSYQNFLLVVAYWLGPWLGVVFADLLVNRTRNDSAVIEERHYTNRAGPVALVVGMVTSIMLFSNQTQYQGLITERHPGIGDITFAAGFLISAAVFSLLVRTALGPRLAGQPLT
ncbi:cytosine permease [soil metagenome]